MASSELINTLVDLTNVELKENRLAKVIAFYYEKLDKRDHAKFYESLVLFYKSVDTIFPLEEIPRIAEKEVDYSSLKNRDFRIKNIQISNVRGIPNKQNGVPFGINFTLNKEINSAVILGPNGTGKSSLAAAIEMIYSQEIGEKNLRSSSKIEIGSSLFNRYLERLDFGSGPPECIIDTPEGSFSLQNKIFKDINVLKTLNPSNHFISDYDIYEYGKLNYSGTSFGEESFHYLIAQSLGLHEYLNFQNLIEALSQYNRQKESRPLNSAKEERRLREDNIKNWNSEIEAKSEVIRQKTSEVETQNIDNAEDGVNRFREQLNELANNRIQFLPEARYYNDTVEKFISDFLKTPSINEPIVSEDNFLKSGLELLEHSKDCPFCRNSKISHSEIKHEVQNRLQKLFEMERSQQEIRRSFKELINVVQGIYHDLNRFWNILTIEREKIKSISRLSSLLEWEGALYIKLSPIVNDEGLITFIERLEKKITYTFDDYRSIYTMVSENQIFRNFIPNLLREIEDFNAFRRNQINSVLNSLNDRPRATSTNEEIRLLRKEIVLFNEQIKDARRRVSVLNAEIDRLEQDIAIFNKIRSEAEALSEIFQIKVNSVVGETFLPIKDTIEDILRDYFLEEKNISIQILQEPRKNKIEGTDEIVNTSILVAKIVKSDPLTGKLIETTPDHYFNTFRYRLFCLMVSLSVAIANRVKYKINLPLILDDLFFASDYISKATFSVFLKKLLYIFNKYSPDLPVQFIMFTHDDLIFSSSIDALDDEDLGFSKHTLFGRLFRPSDKESKVTELENGTKFWSLIFTIPTTININQEIV